MFFCPWTKTLDFTSLADKSQNALEYLSTMRDTRVWTVCLAEWFCYSGYNWNTYSLKMWLLKCFLGGFFMICYFFSTKCDSQPLQTFCTMCLGNVCQRERRRGPRTSSPNARGCFELGCALRVIRLRESGSLSACISKKELIILHNWQAAGPLMRCIPKWNCWKWTLYSQG